MPDYSQHTICVAFTEIVERLTFMFGEAVDKTTLETEGVEFTVARMAIEGDLNGVLTLAVPSEKTAEIAANILGLDAAEITDPAVLHDALGELLNVACGRVAVALAGPAADFKLRAPEVLEASEALIDAMLASPDYLGFDLDDGPALLGLSTEN